MLSTDCEVLLDSILKKFQDKTWKSLTLDELGLIITVFSPSQPLSLRSKGYIALTAFCQRIRETSSKPDAATETIVNTLSPSITSKLAETDEPDLLHGLTFLSSLFQVDWQAASSILAQDGIVESVMDSTDLFPQSKDISLSVAQLLGQATGHKTARATLSPQSIEWLEAKSRQTEDTATRAASAVALVKLSRGAESDASILGGATKLSLDTSDDALVKLMKHLVISGNGPSTSSLSDAVEGLAYLSIDPKFKEQLSSDTAFLAHLFSLVPHRKHNTPTDASDTRMLPIYGAVLIISNICAYRPRLSQEDAQMAKLKRMAKAGGKGQAEEDPEIAKLEDDEHAQERCCRLMKAGVADTLTAAVKSTDSRAVRLLVGKALLSLVEDKDNRGKVLQAGGAKALTTIINSVLPSSSPSTTPNAIPPLDPSEIVPIQALAKLAITASPVQVFGPNSGALLDAIRPFVLMLIHPSSNLLQQFEAIMALTNLSSSDPAAGDRIAKAEGLLNKVELLMFENHTLIRRAATELICNLVAGSDDVFDRYGGQKNSSAKSKIQVLVALCDVDDLPTRSAASGALASLTASPEACQLLLELQQEKHRILPILAQLIDPTIVPPPDESAEEVIEEIRSPTQGDPGLVHRGVVCIRNFFVGVVDMAARKELTLEAQQLGLVKALAQVFREYSADRSAPVLRPAAEALKSMMECGVSIIAT
ncbi:hypothetical protein QCA50_002240 [Cerrena zonata]|uniref:UNC-45/Cro1/She4 central domain-containing protein n=1 Tax=Cerrena zonata TaxID=2478898 RepID=A0AAW0GQY5_9APHY